MEKAQYLLIHDTSIATEVLVALKAKFWYTQDVSKNPI